VKAYGEIPVLSSGSGRNLYSTQAFLGKSKASRFVWFCRDRQSMKKGSLAGALVESKPAAPVWIAIANQTRAEMA
jgi:hypothetical protein